MGFFLGDCLTSTYCGFFYFSLAVDCFGLGDLGTIGTDGIASIDTNLAASS